MASSAVDADYHAEGQIIAGNIHVQTDRAPNKGTALATCDPDPRADPHARPDDCSWAMPAGAGRDLLNFGRHIPDADVSADGAFAPAGSATRENFNGKAGFDSNGAIFVGDFFDDDDMHFRLTPRTLDGYVAPNGDPNNRWRRFCGTGVIDQFNNQNPGGAPEHPPLAPFAAGQVRKFIVEAWDADFRDPSDQDGGNQDYWVIDILKPGSLFDTSRCQEPDDDQPPAGPGPAGAGTPVPVSANNGSLPALAHAASAPSITVVGSAALRGPNACIATAFNSAVHGRGTAHVDFTVDGHRIARPSKRDRSGDFRAAIRVKGMKSGSHEVTARVVFTAGGAAKTLHLAFSRCAHAASRPAFTG